RARADRAWMISMAGPSGVGVDSPPFLTARGRECDNLPPAFRCFPRWRSQPAAHHPGAGAPCQEAGAALTLPPYLCTWPLPWRPDVHPLQAVGDDVPGILHLGRLAATDL